MYFGLMESLKRYSAGFDLPYFIKKKSTINRNNLKSLLFNSNSKARTPWRMAASIILRQKIGNIWRMLLQTQPSKSDFNIDARWDGLDYFTNKDILTALMTCCKRYEQMPMCDHIFIKIELSIQKNAKNRVVSLTGMCHFQSWAKSIDYFVKKSVWARLEGQITSDMTNAVVQNLS